MTIGGTSPRRTFKDLGHISWERKLCNYTMDENLGNFFKESTKVQLCN